MLVPYLAAELRTQLAHHAVRGEAKEVTLESLVNQELKGNLLLFGRTGPVCGVVAFGCTRELLGQETKSDAKANYLRYLP